MKKLFAFVAAALCSAAMFAAAPANIPTDIELNAYKAEGANVVVGFYFPDTAVVCNDIYFTGTVSGWSLDPTACPVFEPVEGHEGWFVTSFYDASADIQGKPMHAKQDGSLSWDFQVGDDVELYYDHRAGLLGRG